MGQQDSAQKKTDFPDWVATDPESVGGTQNLVPGFQIVVYILAVTAVTQLVLLFARIACTACTACIARIARIACTESWELVIYQPRE